MSVSPYEPLKPISPLLPPSLNLTQSESNEEKVFYQTISKKNTANEGTKLLIEAAAEINPFDSPSMLDTKEKTTTVVSKAEIVGKKRQHTSLDMGKNPTEEATPKARKLEADQDIGDCKKENLDSTSAISSVENQKITIENIPSLIKDKTMTEIMEIRNKANALLPKNWIDEIKDLPTKALFLIAQYETENISLAHLYKDLNLILEPSKYTLHLEKRTIPTVEQFLSLHILPQIEKNDYDLLKVLSKIKTLTRVFLDAKALDPQIEKIVFPFVTRVDIGHVFNVQCLYPLNFTKLFPSAKHYGFQTRSKEMNDLLNKIPTDITALTCMENPKFPLSLTTLLYIKKRFEALQALYWSNEADGTGIFVPFSNLKFTRKN